MQDRKVQILKNDDWEDIDFDELKIGDIVRMFEPDGRRVKDNNGIERFVIKAPYKMYKDGVSAVNVEPAKG